MGDTWPMTAGSLTDRLVEAVLADPVCAGILGRLPALGLPDWWLTAGAVFQNVWNSLSGRPPGEGIKDYDVFYLDGDDLSWEAEDRVIREVSTVCADLDATIEVRNQARVHLWYEAKFGVAAAPFVSARDAIGAFAATTCCVGLTARDGQLTVYAPHGLTDVFDMRLRPNPRLAPRAVYEAKAADYQRRWPAVSADPWPLEVAELRARREHLSAVDSAGLRADLDALVDPRV